MNTKPPIKTILPLAAVAGLALSLAPTAQAEPVEYVDFTGDASALLNLTGRDVLAAVNFWDPDREGDGSRSVDNPIQGVTFDNFRSDVDDAGSFALTSVAAGATLTTVISQGDGREFKGDNSADGNTNQTQIGTFSASADNTEAERLAQGGAYYQDHTASDLTFAFGAGYANTTVEVQMLGGGVWNKEPEDPNMGILTASVSGVDLGYVEDQGYNMQLSTFETTTDGNGDLLIDLTLTGDRYAILAGMIVTVAGSSSSFPLTITPNGANYDFSWERQDEKLYDLVSNTDLSIPRADWPVYMGKADIAGSLPNPLENVPGDGTERFFAVVEKDPPPPPALFDEDFEEDNGGFTATTTAGTAWAHGDPDSDGPGGSVTGGNGASTNCWGTNLGAYAGGTGNPGFYVNPTTESCLRTPDIDLTGVTGAQLTFAEALDVEAGDTAELKLIKAAGDVELATVYTVVDGDITTANWAAANGGTPIDLSAGAGMIVYLQWCLSGTGGSFGDYLGWYIDDVVITETP